MKKLLIIVAAIVICLLTWRFWPQSLPNLISADETSITAFSSTVMVHRIENGQPITDTYSINTEQQSNEPSEILEILEKSSYRQDFRNLLPWDLNYVDADKNYDGRTAMLEFSVGNQKDEWVEIQFLSSSIIAVSVGGESEFRIYHPTNHVILDELVEYFQIHDANQKEGMTNLGEIPGAVVHVVDIWDQTMQEQIACDSALEKFWEDETNEYYFNCIKSQHIMVMDSTGRTVDVVTALSEGLITIGTLDSYSIGYDAKPKNIEDPYEQTE